MKKILLITCAVLLVGTLTTAQRFDLGVKGGYLYSDMNVNNVKAMKSKAKGGYLLGVFARIGGEKWFFQPELQYRARTADFEFKDIAQGKIEVDYKTLDIPLQLGIDLLDLSVAKIALHTGPVVSFKLDESTDANFKSLTVAIDDHFKDYKSLIWAGQVGVSVDILRFTIDLTYEKGFTDIAERGAGKNDLFMATLGIKLL